MAKVFNRARMTTETTGTGTITLGSAVTGYQSFASAGVANGDVIYYTIEDGSAWEIGYGTYTSVGTTLTRNRLESSSGALLSLTGAAQVFITAPKEAVNGVTGGGNDAVFVVNSKTVTASFAIPSGQNASSVGPITINSGATVTVPSGSRWVVF